MKLKTIQRYFGGILCAALLFSGCGNTESLKNTNETIVGGTYVNQTLGLEIPFPDHFRTTGSDWVRQDGNEPEYDETFKNLDYLVKVVQTEETETDYLVSVRSDIYDKYPDAITTYRYKDMNPVRFHATSRPKGSTENDARELVMRKYTTRDQNVKSTSEVVELTINGRKYTVLDYLLTVDTDYPIQQRLLATDHGDRIVTFEFEYYSPEGQEELMKIMEDVVFK